MELSINPPAFPLVRGHASITAMVSRALARKMLHHGLLLHGPKGVGKATLARGLGCALLCEVAPALGCGTCNTCLRVLAGRHTDVVVVQGEGKSRNIKRDQIREIVLSCQSAPYEGAAHLVIIDPADCLTVDAANVLLKTLEEPRPGVYFALLAANLDGVLPTLRSRTLAIALGRLPDQDVRQIVSRLVEARESPKPDPNAYELAIALAEGSPGVALQLLHDPSLVLTREVLTQALLAGRQGASGVFCGDDAPLWQAFNRAVQEAYDSDEDDGREEPAVVIISGKGGKRKSERAVKVDKKTTSDDANDGAQGKQSPAKQRLALQRLSELWLLHLRESLRDRHALPDVPDLRPLGKARQVGQMRLLERLQQQLDGNANVRLAFEVLLLHMHPLLRPLSSPERLAP